MLRAETKADATGEYVRDSCAEAARRDLSTQQPTAGTVHDLGNLIQIALSAINRIVRDPAVPVSPSLEPVIAGARTALLRAGALVRETMSRAQASRRDVEETDVSACLTEVEALIRCVCDPRIQLTVRVAFDLPSAKCDRLGLQNAVLNLVFNARDAMPDGGLISIDAAAVQGHVAFIELRIVDGGIGMTQETVARAFEPFFTTRASGLGGVGLPMVKHFALEHGGSIDIESTLGVGTTVILRVPAVPPELGVGDTRSIHSMNG
ncbi:ATP-binding protein [Mesorhizobium sp.]|uniref:sensor histidine kinase n=1 Tax=Mesorhizobium sp. TaxID=1871066 RepID=UPI000FE92970|nr:ATP-binding protein [Mesorhizobium sp.]RWM18551.1 MAG: ATP-binding protein [Mesorhizobium sp.]RWM35771.1 MAG: ATP-binding protein [Mesorhizobium sp.]TIO72684.1 MAG: ATP-binding protein [Mesorhizobium sp.]TIO80702.1 MAG: ATP-binding protein [Mesorhizobium sp.]TJV49132.1 MAG: ATP-binding protein [Mesorhizobium sp.]